MTRLLHLARNLAASVGLLVLLITVTPALRWWTHALSAPWGPDHGDTLVILGGEMYAPDTVGLSTYWRSFYGALVWRTGHFNRVIVSGRNAAPLMADFLVSHGVPRDVIILENDSDSTRENAVNVAKILGPNAAHIVMLTSDYHAGRALRAFHTAGIPATALPYPDMNKRLNAWPERWTVFLILSAETVRTAWYRAHGW